MLMIRYSKYKLKQYILGIGQNAESTGPNFQFDSDVGTIQGSILGPILYALFVSPLFDLTQITNFADDNFYMFVKMKRTQ